MGALHLLCGATFSNAGETGHTTGDGVRAGLIDSEVADGQQRLATVSILIAAIRDYLGALGAPEDKATIFPR